MESIARGFVIVAARMDSLETQLNEQLVDAIKTKDVDTANVIRMINTRILERRSAKDFSGEVDDALILDVIVTYKQQMETVRASLAADGAKSAEHLKQIDFEVKWCTGVLMQRAPEVVLRPIISKVIAGLPAKDPSMLTRVVADVMKQLDGHGDSSLIKKLAHELLSA